MRNIKKIGNYRILKRLGTGGMAEVFLTKSTGAEGIDKILVLKRILPNFSKKARFTTMFLNEAKVAMRLNHPNIVQMYAFEEIKGEFFLAMELVDGLDLGKLIKLAKKQAKTLPYSLSAYIVLEVAKGLDYAHKRKDESGIPMQIVHRDISPQNILLTHDGIVKIADFGIAKAGIISDDTGMLKGKFPYMSPEQARGERVDHKSDVYSLGILFAELLMNRSMYPNIHGLDVLEYVKNGSITLPQEVDSDVPEALQRITGRATALDQEERYQSARSMAGDLIQYLHSLDEFYDSEFLERFIEEVDPRVSKAPLSIPNEDQDTSWPSDLSSDLDIELKERRNVVMIAVQILKARSDHTFQLQGDFIKVLENLAYKTNAIIRWPKEYGASQLIMIIGAGSNSVNDPLKAIQLAIDILEATEGLGADKLIQLDASIGISLGVITTTKDKRGRLFQYAPLDNTREIALALMYEAKTKEILVTDEVYRFSKRYYQFLESRTIEQLSTTVVNQTATIVKVWPLQKGMYLSQRELIEGKRSTLFFWKTRCYQNDHRLLSKLCPTYESTRSFCCRTNGNWKKLDHSPMHPTDQKTNAMFSYRMQLQLKRYPSTDHHSNHMHNVGYIFRSPSKKTIAADQKEHKGTYTRK